MFWDMFLNISWVNLPLAEGKKGGQFYTPRSVVELLVEMLEPYKGRVFDPCCGSGGMFVHSEKFVTEHQESKRHFHLRTGKQPNHLATGKMNLAIRGIDSSQVKWNNEGSFLNDAHKDLKADYIIANPPFNVSDWSGDLLRNDGRWQYGTPPTGNANYAWMQHFIYHLAPLSPNLYIDFEKFTENMQENQTQLDSIFLSFVHDNRASLEKQIQKNISVTGISELSNLPFSTMSGNKLLKLERLLFNRFFVHYAYSNTFGQVELINVDNKDFESIPKGWRIEKLAQVAVVIDCLHSKKPDRVIDTDFTLLEVNNIGDNGLLILSDKYSISAEDYYSWIRNIEVRSGDCIITNTGRIGAVAQIPEGKTFAIGRNMTAVRVNEDYLTPTYIINYLLSHYMKFETYRKTDIGTILDSLNVKGIKKLLVLIPPIELLETYELFARPLRRLIEISFDN
jgi:hypothetical protein